MIRNTDKAMNAARQAIAGVRKHFANTPALSLEGVATTPNAVAAELQAAIDAADAAAALEKAFHDAVAAKHAAFAKTTARLRALKTLVQNQLGSSQEILGDFGFSNTKPRVPDEATKAAAVAKRAATRAARHTMGKRQKAPIKGASLQAAANALGLRDAHDAPGAGVVRPVDARRVDDDVPGSALPRGQRDDRASAEGPAVDGVRRAVGPVDVRGVDGDAVRGRREHDRQVAAGPRHRLHRSDVR